MENFKSVFELSHLWQLFAKYTRANKVPSVLGNNANSL